MELVIDIYPVEVGNRYTINAVVNGEVVNFCTRMWKRVAGKLQSIRTVRTVSLWTDGRSLMIELEPGRSWSDVEAQVVSVLKTHILWSRPWLIFLFARSDYVITTSPSTQWACK